MVEFIKNGEVMALSFPGKEGGDEFVGWSRVSIRLRCVKMKATEGINLRAIRIGPFMMETCESLVDISDEGRLDE